MSEDKFEPRIPDFSGDGIAVWKDKDKNDKTILRVKKPEWKQAIVCFKLEPKPKEDDL